MKTIQEIVDSIMVETVPLLTEDNRLEPLVIEDKIVQARTSIAREYYDARRSLDGFFQDFEIELEPYAPERTIKGSKISFEMPRMLHSEIPVLHGNLDLNDSMIYTIDLSRLVDRVAPSGLNVYRLGQISSPSVYAIMGPHLYYRMAVGDTTRYLHGQLILSDPRDLPGYSVASSIFPVPHEALFKILMLVKRDVLAYYSIPQDQRSNGVDDVLKGNLSTQPQQQQQQNG